MVLGCAGAGKTTFSRWLHDITQNELIYLDQYYWKPNWQVTETSEWEEVVSGLAAKPEWIIDGNYMSTIEVRAKRADGIIFLDCPTWKCLWRVTRRILKYHGKVRPDMPEGCRERFDWKFYHYVLTFNIRRRKKILQLLGALQDQKRIFILKNNHEVHSFLRSLNGK